MEPPFAKRDTGRARRGRPKPDEQAGQDQPNRKRPRSVKDEDEDPASHTRRSLRIQESRQKPCTPPSTFNKRRRTAENESLPQPPRKSPRLQEIRALNQRRIARSGKRTGSSPRTTEAPHFVGQQQLQAECGTLRNSAKQRPAPQGKDDQQSEFSSSKPEAPKSDQQQQRVEDGDQSDQNTKPPEHGYVSRQLRSRLGRGKEDFIENWLNESYCSRRALADNGSSFEEALGKMPRETADVLPLPDDSFNSIISPSKTSEKSTARVHDTDYRDSLGHRNIYIERHKPPEELVRRATRIISRPRASPEIDDATIEELRCKSRELQDETEREIAIHLGPHIIPAMRVLPDPRLARNSDQPWFKSVPVPLKSGFLTNPLPLPRPKPDLAFGYSASAFNENQLQTIALLIDDQFGRSYAVPDQKLRFPFLDIEFKSQAKSGTHYIATNQVAGAGAIALNGHLELMQRSFGMEGFDYDEPQFFSVTMDHELVRVNVHWLRAPAEGGQHSFHVEKLSRHFLDDANAIRAAVREIKNILEYGSDARLRTICEALDAYRKTFIAERGAMNRQRD